MEKGFPFCFCNAVTKTALKTQRGFQIVCIALYCKNLIDYCNSRGFKKKKNMHWVKPRKASEWAGWNGPALFVHDLSNHYSKTLLNFNGLLLTAMCKVDFLHFSLQRSGGIPSAREIDYSLHRLGLVWQQTKDNWGLTKAGVWPPLLVT